MNPLLLSIPLYSWLLIFYPAAYRREYGAQMTQLFRDICRSTYQKDGWLGLVRSWLHVLFDLALTILEQHRQESLRVSHAPWARKLTMMMTAMKMRKLNKGEIWGGNWCWRTLSPPLPKFYAARLNGLKSVSLS